MRYVLLIAAVTVAGCTAPSRVAPVASTPVPVTVVPVSGGYGNLAVPDRLADGSYATPNRGVSGAGAIWHLRAGLNVAALSCRGTEEAALIANYNALLQRHRTEFDGAYRALGTEHGGNAPFDAAMTRLYNYYAMPPAKPGLCAAAQAVLADAAQVPTGGMATFAPAALARLDRPYTQIFAAQEAWLATRNRPATTQVAAVSAPTVAATVAPAPAPAPAPALAQPRAAQLATAHPVTQPGFSPSVSPGISPGVSKVSLKTQRAAAPQIAIDVTVASAALPIQPTATAAAGSPRIAIDQAVLRMP